MKRTAPLLLPVALLALLAACASGPRRTDDVTIASAPRSLPANGRVDVAWTDPAQFIEVRYSRNRWEAVRGDWVRLLAEHLREEADARLPPGERLDVTLTDIDRAGDYEFGNGASINSVRVLRDLYPPRMELSFTLHGADGTTLAEGDRALNDLGYLNGSAAAMGDSDPLRYDKRLIDDWVRKEFRAPDR